MRDVLTIREVLALFTANVSHGGREVTGLPPSVAGGECRFLAVPWEKLFLVRQS